MPEPVAMIVTSGTAQAAGLVPAAPALRTRSSLTRADWRLMLGLSRAESVLVVGADAWELGRALSPWVGQVFGAVDDVPTCDTTRVVAIRGDQASLPLTERVLDWIIFDGRIPGDGDVQTSVERVLPT